MAKEGKRKLRKRTVKLTDSTDVATFDTNKIKYLVDDADTDTDTTVSDIFSDLYDAFDDSVSEQYKELLKKTIKIKREK